MVAIIALIIAVLALFGTIFHAMMADTANGGIAHVRTPLSEKLAARYPATFAPPTAITPTAEPTT